MNKRGEAATVELLMLMGGLGFSALVGFFLLSYATNILSGSTLEKNFFARDIALTLEAIYAAPAPITFTYDMGDFKYFVDIRQDVVIVRDDKHSASYRIIGISAADISKYGSPLNPEGYQTRLQAVRMLSYDDVAPIKLKFTKKFTGESAVIEIDAENARVCKIGINCPTST